MSQCSTCQHYHDGDRIHVCSLGLEAVEDVDGKKMPLGYPAVGDGKCDKYEKQIIEDEMNVG